MSGESLAHRGEPVCIWATVQQRRKGVTARGPAALRVTQGESKEEAVKKVALANPFIWVASWGAGPGPRVLHLTLPLISAVFA